MSKTHFQPLPRTDQTGAGCGAGSVRVGTAAEGGANRLSGHRTRHHSRPKQGYFWLATMLIPAHPCAQVDADPCNPELHAL